MDKRLSLSGTWDMSIGGKVIDKIKVPSSYNCVGEAVLSRKFELAEEFIQGRRCFLTFDAVLSVGEARVNKTCVGRLGPWVPYSFEIRPLTGENTISVSLKDIPVKFGPAYGRSFFGGIIRDVYIISYPSTFMDHYMLTYNFSDDYSKCLCCLKVRLSSREGEKRLTIKGELVSPEESIKFSSKGFDMVKGSKEIEISFEVKRPLLWSPESPHLYTLNLSLLKSNRCIHKRREKTGLREIKAKGRDLFLNGRKIFLKGICRHDFMLGYGYTLTDEQVRKDMEMIKSIGANYVRLVHSPHGKKVIEIADEIGLLVSEEPATCWCDHLDDPEVIQPAMEVLRRLIMRDYNSPSVFAWIVYNECKPNLKYTRDCVKLCRKMDPLRLVSQAETINNYKRAKEISKKCGIDYYSLNHYNFDINDYRKRMKELSDLPLVFSEWGGALAVGNPRLIRVYGEMFVKAAHSSPDDPHHLSGISFWAWADYEQRNRGGWVCERGIVIEGLISEERVPKEDMYVMKEIFSNIDCPPLPEAPKLTMSVPRIAEEADTEFNLVDLSSLSSTPSQIKVWEKFVRWRSNFSAVKRHVISPDYYEMSIDPVIVAGIPFKPVCDRKGKWPLSLHRSENEMVFTIGRKASKIAFLGHTTLFKGYPVEHSFGKPIARYIIEYEGKKREEVILKAGEHYARQNMLYDSWLINPVAIDAPQAFTIAVDQNFEIDQVRYFIYKPKRYDVIKHIRWVLEDRSAIPLLYALTTIDRISPNPTS